MKQKKILLLGGSVAQLIAIKKAKNLGYYTILCDYLLDNPGQKIADSFHLVSTTDKDAVLQVAQQEGIDGIVAYGTDPAAPTAAYIANAMNLPGLDYDLVRHFCEKHLFRQFLSNHGFNVPNYIEVNDPNRVDGSKIATLQFPLIVKPTDSSGSKGVTVIENRSELDAAIRYAKEYSHNGTLIIEEYIRRDHPFVIEAEIFALNGKVVTWGLINSIRDTASNPLVPAAYSYPLELSESRKRLVRSEISRLVAATGNTSGAFNIEMIIDKNDRLYFLDVGPRSGGNMLPEFISMIAQKDIVEATIKTAMGDDISKLDVSLNGEEGGYWGLNVLHSTREGRYQGVVYSDKAKAALVREEIQKKYGDQVHPFRRCNDLIGLIFLHSASHKDMDDLMLDTNQSMRVIIK
jgi:biotin carboxylase